jgi:hypothetical protein
LPLSGGFLSLDSFMDHKVSYPTISVEGKNHIQPQCTCGWKGENQSVDDTCPKTMAMSDYFNHINTVAGEEKKARQHDLEQRVISMRQGGNLSQHKIGLAVGLSQTDVSKILKRALCSA